MNALFDLTSRTKWYISSDGTAFSITGNVRREKRCSLHKKRGYCYIRTSNGNYLVHRIVASAFIPNPSNKPCINHKDGNKKNNNISNLEWVTYKENFDHALKNGFIKLYEKNNGANLKYSNSQCRDVIKRISNGLTYKEAGKKYNMPYSTVAYQMDLLTITAFTAIQRWEDV
jgi:hypothetical protein